MKNIFSNKKILILSFIFLILELSAIIEIVNVLKEVKSYPYETTATIYFIGLADGTVFVSCYDENNVLHKDVAIRNKTIQGKSDYVNSFYGKEIQILFNSKENKAISLPDFHVNLTLAVIVPLMYLMIILICYFIYKKRLIKRQNI